MALARRVKIAALSAPFLIGPKALLRKGLFSKDSIYSLVSRDAEGLYYE
jgi:hypothetical protein